jgi:hypothetical protein
MRLTKIAQADLSQILPGYPFSFMRETVNYRNEGEMKVTGPKADLSLPLFFPSFFFIKKKSITCTSFAVRHSALKLGHVDSLSERKTE